MFTGLKNKIKEETGSDPTKLSLSSPPQKITHGSAPKGHHSRQGSGSSLGSLSLDGVREELVSSPSVLKQDTSEIKLPDGKVLNQKEVKRLEKREDEWRRKLQKVEEDWTKKLEKKEEEWKKQVEEKQRDWRRSIELLEKEKVALEEEKREIVQQKLNLEEALKAADEYKKKVIQYQEDIEQLEGLQTQEMAKIKHLLLVKEQEVAEKADALKEASSQIESLKLEVTRLRHYEEELANLQDDLETLRHSSDQECFQLSGKLAQSEEEVRHLKDRVAVLEQRTNAECVNLGAELTVNDRIQALLGERRLLDRRLEEAHLHLLEIKSSWSGKILSLETQVGRLSRQAAEEGKERRRAEQERDALMERIKALEVIVEKGKSAAKEKDDRIDRLKKERDELIEELKDTETKRDQEVGSLQQEIVLVGNENEGVKTRLFEAEKRLREVETEFAHISIALEDEKSSNTALHLELAQLRDALEAEQTRSANLSISLNRERGEKDVTLLRNAQVNQQVELAKQELREQEQEAVELHNKIIVMEKILADKDMAIEKMKIDSEELSKRVQDTEMVEHDKQAAANLEQELRNNISELEEQLIEKNKRLSDMKKTLQHELRLPTQSVHGTGTTESDSFIPAAVLTPSSSRHLQQKQHQQPVTNHRMTTEDDDVNFKYLKHVLIKFLTSREYEAQHLTRAVATLLRFSPEEERLLRETLEWKMSWFGTRPSLGFGQTAKTIPPS
ncbi:golgin subfamily A member 1 isoform X2 [Cryptotermes secundus]|uniref:golgin subfamily A member 1 isoform X2 n=1 Tax=Cryptotermes secundus TaxID=105785 RepID=UPI000CD7BEB6|nr:golgin subfamily A member 1 isoform X2 [Cryptotermes secundus]